MDITRCHAQNHGHYNQQISKQFFIHIVLLYHVEYKFSYAKDVFERYDTVG